MQQRGARSGAAVIGGLVLVLAGVLGCSSGKSPEGMYELVRLDVEIQDPVKGYLEFKQGGELVAHWLVPESVIQVLSGFMETPAERRHQTKGSPEHFVGSWQTSGQGVELRVAGRGPSCKLEKDTLECAGSNGQKQLFRALAKGKAPDAWIKSGKPVKLSEDPADAKTFEQAGEGERLSLKLRVDKGASTQAVRADVALKKDGETGALFAPKSLGLRIAYPLLGDWPVATMTFENVLGCESVKPEHALSRMPIAFLRGRPSVQALRIDLVYGCPSCSACATQVENKTVSFVAGR
jgi:hypothetical protein